MSFANSIRFKKHRLHTVVVQNLTTKNKTTHTKYRFICVTCARGLGNAPKSAALRFKAMQKPAGVKLADLFVYKETKDEN